MEAAGGTRGGSRQRRMSNDGRDLVALRAQVERTIAHNRKLREMANRTGYSPEDVASEALARYLAASDDGIENPTAWMVRAGRNFVYDLHRKGLQRETAADPTSHSLEQPLRGEEVPVDERLDRRYENKLYDAAVRRLEERDQQAIAAFEIAGSMRAVEKEYGIPKSSVQRAFKRLQGVIASETGRQATRRARSRALAYHLGYMSPPQAAEIKARLKWDTGLLMAIRSLELGGRRAVALLPPGGIAVDTSARSGGFADRLLAAADSLRSHAYALAGRGSGHEAETAGGIAGGGATAGFATKAIVAACIGGSAAAGVGGACVATGVVDLPGGERDRSPVAEKTVPETTTTEPTATTPTPAVTPPSGEAAQQATVPDPVAQVNKELYGGGASSGSSGSSSGSRDFAAPVSSSSTSSGGGGGGGSSGRENFGP
jgi:DNA-directed RNA polymerase specialized sigma24 family protein